MYMCVCAHVCVYVCVVTQQCVIREGIDLLIICVIYVRVDVNLHAHLYMCV